jgi:hypothetical protein
MESFGLAAQSAGRVLLHQRQVVGGHDYGSAFLGATPQQRENLLACLGVEIAGRFVGKYQARLVEERAGYHHTLLLAA